MIKLNKYNYILILIANLITILHVSAQNKAVINLTLINAEELILQQRLFFAEQPNYFLDRNKGITPLQLLHSHQLKNYQLTNKSNGSYKIEYSLKTPKLIYINYHPVFIKPGDSLKLTYNVMEHSFYMMHDTLIADGKNGQNYEYSYLIKSATKGNPEDNEVYVNNTDVNDFYRKLKAYYAQLKRDQDSILRQNNCDEELTKFVKRETKRSELFRLLSIEEQLYNSSDNKRLAFSKIVDSEINDYSYEPADTAYNFTTENLIKANFKRDVKLKFNNLNSKEDYLIMVSYISNIRDSFIKDYYLYFLLMNFHSLDVKYPSAILQECKKNIKNIKIKSFLVKQSYL